MTNRTRRLISSVVLHAILAFASILVLIPFVWLLCAAFKTNRDFFPPSADTSQSVFGFIIHLFLPKGDGVLGVAWDRLTTDHFVRLFRDLDFARYMINSFFLASVTSVVATLLSAMAGFALARYRFRGRNVVMMIVLLVLIIPPPLILAPTYQLLFRIDLLNTFPGLILPMAAPAFGVFLFRQAMLTSVPPQLLEAARIDGCGEFRIFFQIALPLVRPMIGAFLLITFLAMWNNFIWPQVVLQSPEQFPLAVAVAQLNGLYYQEYGLLMAGTLVSVIPVLVLFMLLQSEFIAGLTSGAVKG